ncbi:hypothetical protein Pcinc_010162 [Petrolisthes cinctipes]|uniref:Uncharacterized protein n=1 Tax=Petrolisthes cinctipes TaxID=88211 RepID=A0AAE1G3B2_PETCI|nr:hypothetical protein Pcinc_010162 [Petrolisthes cinctipes]
MVRGNNNTSLEHVLNSVDRRRSNFKQDLRCFLSGCLNFSCEGNALLDDENVPCLKSSSPDSEPQDSVVPISCIVPTTISAPVVSSSGLVSYTRPAETFLIHSNSLEGQERENVICDMKKQICKSYSSFSSSPPLDVKCKAIQPPSTCSNYLTDVCEELTPLISKNKTECEENTDIGRNEIACVIKKELSYNKILPFPVISKIISSHESSAGIHSVVEYDTNTNSHSVVVNYEQDIDNTVRSTTNARDTMILCNDLDSACQVVPLAFRPNLLPDGGSVPLVTGTANIATSDPGVMVSTSCKLNTQNISKSCPSQPASWPRRRPQSLRVALCYSDPDRLKSTAGITRDSLKQDIDLSDIPANRQGSSISKDNCEENSFLQMDTCLNSEDVKEKQDSLSISQMKYSTHGSIHENLTDQTLMQEDDKEKQIAIGGSTVDRENSNKNKTDIDVKKIHESSSEEEISERSLHPTNVLQIHKTWQQPHAGVESNQCVINSSDCSLLSPGSDKENNPVLLSVRPKVLNSGMSHSPKKKKTSPKRKHKSPRKLKLEILKDGLQGSIQAITKSEKENIKNNKTKNQDDDVWAVDDFLPVSKPSQSHCKNQSLHTLKQPLVEPVSPTPSALVDSTLKALLGKSTSTPCGEEMDSSMFTSTFSTDTGYETETNMNPLTVDEISQSDGHSKPICRKVMQHQQPIRSKFIKEGSKCQDTLATPTLCSNIPSPVDHISSLTVKCDTAHNGGMCPEGSDAGQSSFSFPSKTTSNVNHLQCPEASSEVPNQLGEKTNAEELKRQLSLDVDDVVPSKSNANDKTLCLSKDKNSCPVNDASTKPESSDLMKCQDVDDSVVSEEKTDDKISSCPLNASTDSDPAVVPECQDTASGNNSVPSSPSSNPSPANTPSQELVEVKYMQLSLSIVLAIVLHAMQSISQFMLEVFLSTDHDDPWDKM